jgi:hypothetical protein
LKSTRASSSSTATDWFRRRTRPTKPGLDRARCRRTVRG